jgi:error-prone DNA polymerase
VALLNSQPMGFYPPHVLVQTARHVGVKVLPVCVQKSEWESTLEGKRGDYAIRMGFHFVTGMAEAAGKELAARRARDGVWADLDAFARGAALSRRDVTALAAADALKAYGVDRRAAIWLAEAAPFCAVLEDVETPLALPPETRMARALSDLTATRTTLGDHFAQIVREELWCYEPDPRRVLLAKDIVKERKAQRVTVFGWVMVRQAPPEAKGFMFLTLEDETGLINLIFQPRVREAYKRLIDGQSFLCITGRVDCDEDAVNIMVSHVHAPEPRKADVVALDPQAKLLPLAEKELAASRNYR